MAKQVINIGSSANDGTGTSLRAGGDLINDNFNEIYTTFGNGTTLSAAAIAIPHKIGGTNFTNSLLIGHSTTGTLNAANENTGIGINALDGLTSGDGNVALGYVAGTSINTGIHNTLVGHSAGGALTSTDRNTFIGSGAGSSVNSGQRNTTLGHFAGQNITSGSGNVMLGSSMTADSATGNRQLKIGGNDGSTTTTWISGDSSGNLTTVGDVTLANDKKVIFGDAGENIVGNGTLLTISSSQNLILDAVNDLKLDGGSGNIYVQDDGTIYGHILKSSTNSFKLRSHVSDADLILEGNDGGSVIAALTFDMSAAGAATFNSNVTVGGDLTVNGTTTTVNSTEVTIQNAFVFEGATADAHETTLTVVDPTADRTITLPNQSGDVIIGKFGGTNFTNSILIGHATTGTLNNAVNNIGIGSSSLDAVTSGDFNVSIGVNAGSEITTSSNNVFLGQDAGRFVSTATGQNMYIGSTSGYHNQTGSDNVAVGVNALKGVSGNSNSFNTGVGSVALTGISTGDRNVGIGYQAGDNITSGNGNVIIGTVDAASATGDRQLKIAGNDGTTTTTWISGDNSGVVTATLAANTITSTQLASATTLLILNSSGSTLKTIIGAGS